MKTAQTLVWCNIAALQFKGNKHIIDYTNWLQFWGLLWFTFSDFFLLINAASQSVEALRSWQATKNLQRANGQPKVKWDMILVARNLPHKIQSPKKLGIEEQRHHYVKYIVHKHSAWLGGCEWIITSILVWNMLETQFYCHNKAKRASADDGPGLQTRSFALVPVTLLGGWHRLKHRFMPSKCNVKAQSLLQSRTKETAGLDMTSEACDIESNWVRVPNRPEGIPQWC